MDRIDWKILHELERNGRVSFSDLADKVGISKSPCWVRVRQKEDDGIIQGYTVNFEPSALGLHVQSFVKVMIRLGLHEEFEAAVNLHPAIIECHTTAGSSDYLLKIFAGSVGHLDDLLRHELSKLPGVDRLDSTICLKTIKRNGPLSNWAALLPT